MLMSMVQSKNQFLLNVNRRHSAENKINAETFRQRWKLGAFYVIVSMFPFRG